MNGIEKHLSDARREDAQNEIDKQRQVVQEYLDMHKESEVKPVKDLGDRLKAALIILKRYNLPWSRRGLRYPEELPEYIKSASNPRAEDLISKALQLPSLYRLNFIKQLSFCCFHRKLDASHHRLPHSLGTAEVAAMLMEAVSRKLPYDWPEDARYEEAEFKAVVLWGLLHDCYHGPMGHAIEPLSYLLTDQRLLKLDKFFLSEALNDDKEASLIVEAALGGRDHSGQAEFDEIKALLKFFASPNSDREKKTEKHFLLDIIDSSQIDADRIDYVLRDAVHLGEPLIDKNRYFDILMNARVVEVTKKTPEDKTRTQRRLAFPIRYKGRAEELLSLRHRFYREYYEHPARIAADEMLCHIIYYYFDRLGVWNADTSGQGKREFLHEFMKLTDENLFPFLLELERFIDVGPDWYPRDMLNDLFANRYFIKVYENGIKAENWSEHLNRFSELNKKMLTITQGQGSKNPPESLDQKREDESTALKKALQEGKTSIDELSYWFAWTLSGDFKRKLYWEDRLWTDILNNKQDDEHESESGNEADVEKYLKYNVYPGYHGYSNNNSQVWESFMKFPQVHIHIPKISTGAREGIAMERSKPPDHEEKARILCYNSETRKAEWEPTNISYPPGEFMPFRVLLTVQFDLAKCQNIDLVVKKCFENMLKSCEWVDGSNK